jgi:isopenicillin N synthase-like dioxygenase
MTFSVRAQSSAALPHFAVHFSGQRSSRPPITSNPAKPATGDVAIFSHKKAETHSASSVRFQGWGDAGQALPVVNLKDFTQGDILRRKAFVQKLGQSLSKYGFVSIAGHQVPEQVVKNYYQTVPAVFGLPMDIKQQYVRADLGRNRGYYELGQETKSVYDGGPRQADLKENWHSGAPDTLNLFPKQGPSQFQNQNLQLFNQMEKTSIILAQALGEYLDSIGLQDKGYLKSLLVDNGKPIGNHLMRTIHYPAVPANQQVGFKPGEPVIRAGQHFDMNLFTLLPEATEAGLQIMPRENGKETGQWLPIHSQAGTLIMNVGDMLSLITGGKVNEQGKITEQGVIPSIRHRVVGDSTTLNKPRYSIPFFATPHYEKPLKNLKTGEDLMTAQFSYNRLAGHGSVDKAQMSLQQFLDNTKQMTRSLFKPQFLPLLPITDKQA